MLDALWLVARGPWDAVPSAARAEASACRVAPCMAVHVCQPEVLLTHVRGRTCYGLTSTFYGSKSSSQSTMLADWPAGSLAGLAHKPLQRSSNFIIKHTSAEKKA